MGKIKREALYLLMFVAALCMFLVLMACLIAIPRGATG
jgi:hypothetical protein